MTEGGLYRGAPPEFPPDLAASRAEGQLRSADDLLFAALAAGASVLTAGYAIACVLERGHPAKGLVACAIVAALFLAAEMFLVRSTAVTLVPDGPWIGIYRGRRLSKVVAVEAIADPPARAHTRFEHRDLVPFRSKLRLAKAVLVSVVGLGLGGILFAIGASISDRDDARLLVAWAVATFVTCGLWGAASLRLAIACRLVILDDVSGGSEASFAKRGLDGLLAASRPRSSS